MSFYSTRISYDISSERKDVQITLFLVTVYYTSQQTIIEKGRIFLKLHQKTIKFRLAYEWQQRCEENNTFTYCSTVCQTVTEIISDACFYFITCKRQQSNERAFVDVAKRVNKKSNIEVDTALISAITFKVKVKKKKEYYCVKLVAGTIL